MIRYYGDFSDFTAEGLTKLMNQKTYSAALKAFTSNQQAAVARDEKTVKNYPGGVYDLTDGNFEEILKSVRTVEGKQVMVLYRGHIKDCKEQQELLKNAAALLESEKNIVLSQVNCDVHRKMCENSGVAGYCHFNCFNSGNMCPMVVGGPRGSAYYDGEWTPEAIRDYTIKKRDGGREYRSQEVPDNNYGPVAVVVGKTFQDQIAESQVHVLAEFYAPWCGMCKQLAPTWEKVGEKVKEEYTGAVRVVKFDASANEVKGFELPQSYPTIMWFRKHEWSCSTCKLPEPDMTRYGTMRYHGMYCTRYSNGYCWYEQISSHTHTRGV
jgi:thioredoxin-like negative regulator of GroEL